ncbi:MarR family transcriptional regulator [Prauserella marina]|uniref:DNA-binding transcriptional regulator, MarR family n=1 Tax=Prauserella marina TaxID=530584 RepID=A0A222VXN4_9PSEU|nr:helix-turn-helix domain-containing GNAT family N-acetyltransferase [Prauserella marina]ASR38736.1 MarR family transcriptional regulator [Prauserella marina]PWV82086.1 MarR family transcriptional regulator with acetyltransferase activity [Prauserella marina]SDD19104.1 DNA-binding transcriptional regulator, MarR family [Prauserella marina]
MNELARRVGGVRAFNRMYTRVIGALDEGLVGSAHSLSEARVLYELAREGVGEVADLRNRLDLDAGYASRLLAKLEAQELLVRGRSDTDARRQTVSLTERGLTTQQALERDTEAQIEALLGTLTEADQRRLLSAMDTISTLLGDRPKDPALVLRPPRAGDYGWIVQRHGELYGEEHGYNAEFEALVARVVADYVSATGTPGHACWIAELDGNPVGSVMCVRADDTGATAKLRLLLVEPSARGTGLGRRLVTECVAFARTSGYREMELWTQSELSAARGLYKRVGFELGSSEPHQSWGRTDLVSEVWRMPLTPQRPIA